MDVTSSTTPPPLAAMQRIVSAALDEDLYYGDVTTSILIPDPIEARAQIIAQDHMMVAGVAVAKLVFHTVDPTIKLTTHYDDGTEVNPSTPILTITGKARSLLQAERVALNFLQQLSGISTLTQVFCKAVRRHPVKIVDTRKTTPGLRVLEKWAVRLGGGHNHRFSLHDGVLIKDNHLLILRARNMNISQTCLFARQHVPHGLRICVEVETLSQIRQALRGKADVLLLDNMQPNQVRHAVRLIQGQALVEVSGGVNLSNIRSMAEAGPDFISIGALTHSAPSMDLSMNILPSPAGRRSRKRRLKG